MESGVTQTGPIVFTSFRHSLDRDRVNLYTLGMKGTLSPKSRSHSLYPYHDLIERVYLGLQNMLHGFPHAVEPGRPSFPTTWRKRLNEPRFRSDPQVPNNGPLITHPEARRRISSHTQHTAHLIQHRSHLPLSLVSQVGSQQLPSLVD